MKKFTEIREGRRSAQDRLSARASKHGLGSQKRLDKIKKSADFFSKPPPSFSKAELKKMGYAVEASSPAQQAAIAIAKKADKVVNEGINVKSIDIFKAAAKDFAKNKDINFQSIADALSTIATMVRSLSMSKTGQGAAKFEKIISQQEVRINNIINKTMYGKGGATPEGREIKKILSKHGLDRTFNGLIFNSVNESTDPKFDAWFKKSQELDKMSKDASVKLKKFPRGPTGLTPDSVKKDPKFKKAKGDADKIFRAIQKHNTGVSKDWFKMARDRRRQIK